MIDIDKLTLGEVAFIEKASNQSIDQLGDEGVPKGNFLCALVFVFKRRENPKYTWNDAKGLGLEEAQEYLGLTEEDPRDEAEEELSEMTVAQLRDIANDKGIIGGSSMTKPVLIAAILDHDFPEEEADPDDDTSDDEDVERFLASPDPTGGDSDPTA